MAGVGGESPQGAERGFEAPYHRVERSYKVGEVGRFFAQRQSAVKAASVRDRRNLGCNLRELPLRPERVKATLA